MHRELEWPVSKATCLYAHLYMVYRNLYKIIDGTSSNFAYPPCSAASFELNSEPHTGARPSVRLCVGPELARCVHNKVARRVSLTSLLYISKRVFHIDPNIHRRPYMPYSAGWLAGSRAFCSASRRPVWTSARFARVDKELGPQLGK